MEEIGEVIHANVLLDKGVKLNSRDVALCRLAVSEEVWDTAFASIAEGYNLGLTNEEMMNGLNAVLEKLEYRWIPPGFSQ